MSPLLVQAVVTIAALLVILVQASTSQQSNPPQNHQNGMATGWSSLHLNQARVHAGLRSINLHNARQPVVSADASSLLYDSFATFMNDSVVYNYAVVNSIVYLSRTSLDESTTAPSVKCLESDVLPSVNSIVSAISEAVAIASSSSTEDASKCSTGKLLKVSVGGTSFTLCYSGSEGFTLYGNDMNIGVEFVNILELTVDTDSTHQCKQVAFSSSITSTGGALLRGESVDTGATRKLKAELDFLSLVGVIPTAPIAPMAPIVLTTLIVPVVPTIPIHTSVLASRHDVRAFSSMAWGSILRWRKIKTSFLVLGKFNRPYALLFDREVRTFGYGEQFLVQRCSAGESVCPSSRSERN